MPPKRKGASRPTNRKFKSNEFKYPDKSIGQEIGIINKAKGNCRFSFTTINGEEKQGVLSGKMKKTPPRFKEKDYVIAEPLSSNENGQYQIIFRYSQNQIGTLKKEGFLVSINNKTDEDNEINTTHFQFEDDAAKNDNGNKIEIDETFLDNL